MFAKRILTKTEQKHLKESGCTTLEKFKRTRETQRRDESRRQPGQPVTLFGCFECRMIARKIGIE